MLTWIHPETDPNLNENNLFGEVILGSIVGESGERRQLAEGK